MLLDDWVGAAVSPSVDGPPSPDDWTPVEVPGRPDRFADADAVAYRTTFPDPRDGEPRAELELRGLYADATLWLNGERLGDHDAYFAPARFPVEPAAENELVVVCRRPADRFGGVYETDLVPDELAVPGIWWDATVEPRPETYLAAVDLAPAISDDEATITVRMTVDAGAAVDDRATLSLRPEGFRGGGTMDRARVEVGAGERTTVGATVEVRDPRLWWPAGVGGQDRYRVRAKLGDSAAEATTGLRVVEYGGDGLVVNGRPVRARGFARLPGGDPAADIEHAVEANANLLRAHAHVPREGLFEAADAAGLLVWQDLPLTGPGGYDADRAAAVASRVADATRRHPSVACYAVHDDPADVADGLAGGRFHRLRLRWRAWRNGGAPRPADAVLSALPGDAVAFPVVGQPGTDADAASLYPGWDYGGPDDVDWLLDWRPDLGTVVGEFGAGALAADGAEPAGLDARKHGVHAGDDAGGSQRYQARALKRVAEALRLADCHAMAAMSLRDTADGGGMGVLARDGTEKPGYDALSAAFEPVQAVLDDPPSPGGETGVTVLNDGRHEVAATLSWRAGDEAGEASVEVAAFSRADAGSVAVPSGADAVTLALDLGKGTVENDYSLD